MEKLIITGYTEHSIDAAKSHTFDYIPRPYLETTRGIFFLYLCLSLGGRLCLLG